MTPELDAVLRPECDRHRQTIESKIDRQVRDLRTDLLAEVERRDGERKDDYRTLVEWMVRVEAKVNSLPEAFQAAVDRKFDRLFQGIAGIILSIVVAGVLAYLGFKGGP